MSDGGLEGIRRGDRRALARAITLVESTRPADRDVARALVAGATEHAGDAVRIGISGAPGAGKSTLIEALGNHIIDAGHRLAVLAVDPSSSLSGGSILGDRTRMPTLSRRPEAFVRPSPSGTTSGGVARRTRETVVLCEAFGCDVVLVETVGVGQSEIAVAGMTDLFLLLIAPGSGDDLQGIKRGVMELADVVCITKADGDLAPAASRAAADHRAALRLLAPRDPELRAAVHTVSSVEGDGVAELWDVLVAAHGTLRDSGALARRRAAQAVQWMWDEVRAALVARAAGADAAAVEGLRARVARGELAPADAAEALLDLLDGSG